MLVLINKSGFCIIKLLVAKMNPFRKVAAIVALFTVLLSEVIANTDGNTPTYRAAVVEFKPIPYEVNDIETLMRNARQVSDYAKQAGQQNVDILAFPEYGITTFRGLGYGRENLSNSDAVQDVPDPKSVEWNPCLEPNKFPDKNTEVLQEVSCAARNNSVAILINLMSRESCSPSSDPKCPSDGHYLHNTNIIFGKNGSLLYRYHKYHLFWEDALNPATEPEYTVIDLGFAKIASITCYDILYKEPGVLLAEKHGIRNIIFSTAWGDELPFYTSPQLMAQFAHGTGSNILAPNMYYPEISRLGSGIYSSSSGALNETWDLAAPGRMAVADVPVNPPTIAVETTTCAGTPLASEDPQAKPQSCINPVLEWSTSVANILTDIPSSQPMANKTHQIWYESLSNYSYINLTNQEGSVELCQGKFCCNATYEFGNRDEKDTYVLAVRNGCRKYGKDSMGIQVCAILRCNTPGDIESCGRVPESQPASRFSKIQISGVFQTDYIFPNIFATTFANVPRDQYQFSKQSCQESSSTAAKAKASLITSSALNDPVLVASLYGRMYEWDISS